MADPDDTKFIVLDPETNVAVANGAVEAEMQEKTKALAKAHEGREFILYQRIGSAQLEPRVVWKGASK